MLAFKKTFADKWAFACVYLGSLVFLFFQGLGFILNTEIFGSIGVSFKKLGLLFAAAVVLALLLSLLLLKLIDSHRLRRLLSPKAGSKTLSYPLIFLVLFLLWLPCYLAFFPGITAYDTGYQWIIFRDSRLTTHHPLLHTLLLGWPLQLAQQLFGSYNVGIALHCLGQLLLQAAVIAYGIFSLQKLRMPRWLFWLISLFYGLFPLFPVLGISTTKDVLFCVFFALAIISAVNASLSKDSLPHIAVFAFALALSMLFRNNAVYAALAVCAVILLCLLKLRSKKFTLRILAAILAAIIAAEFSFAALQRLCRAEDGSPVEMMSVPLQQIGRVYTEHYNELSEDDMDRLAIFFRMDWLELYKALLSDPVKGSFSYPAFRSASGDFVRLWAELGLRFPAAYLDAFFYNTIPLWYLWDDRVLEVKDCYVEMGFANIGDTAYPDSKLPALERLYRSGVEEGGIRDIPILSMLSQMSFYTWVLFAAFVLLLAKRRYELLFIPLLPLMYLATLLLGPCILPRYCFVAIACVPVILGWLVHLANTQS